MSTESSIPFDILTDPNMEILPSENMMPGPTPNFWDDDMKKAIPLSVLAALAADEIFGEKMDEKNDFLFLSSLLDETKPLQSELAAKLGATFEENGFHHPDHISLQVFRRKAGFSQKRQDNDMGRFTAAICLRDFQTISFNREESIVMNGNISQFFELEPHLEKKSSPRPGVPKNRTMIKLPNGKALLKSKQYLCIMAWAFWVDDPVKIEGPMGEFGDEQLKKIIDDLKNKGEFDKADELENIINRKLAENK